LKVTKFSVHAKIDTFGRPEIKINTIEIFLTGMISTRPFDEPDAWKVVKVTAIFIGTQPLRKHIVWIINSIATKFSKVFHVLRHLMIVPLGCKHCPKKESLVFYL
jgi:Na+-transporting NADH:ubiquinone oxidoreductase subunit NqrA